MDFKEKIIQNNCVAPSNRNSSVRRVRIPWRSLAKWTRSPNNNLIAILLYDKTWTGMLYIQRDDKQLVKQFTLLFSHHQVINTRIYRIPHWQEHTHSESVSPLFQINVLWVRPHRLSHLLTCTFYFKLPELCNLHISISRINHPLQMH